MVRLVFVIGEYIMSLLEYFDDLGVLAKYRNLKIICFFQVNLLEDLEITSITLA